jgi:hypothetical protein
MDILWILWCNCKFRSMDFTFFQWILVLKFYSRSRIKSWWWALESGAENTLIPGLELELQDSGCRTLSFKSKTYTKSSICNSRPSRGKHPLLPNSSFTFPFLQDIRQRCTLSYANLSEHGSLDVMNKKSRIVPFK